MQNLLTRAKSGYSWCFHCRLMRLKLAERRTRHSRSFLCNVHCETRPSVETLAKTGPRPASSVCHVTSHTGSRCLCFFMLLRHTGSIDCAQACTSADMTGVKTSFSCSKSVQVSGRSAAAGLQLLRVQVGIAAKQWALLWQAVGRRPPDRP